MEITSYCAQIAPRKTSVVIYNQRWSAAPLKRAPLPLPLLHKNGSAATATAPQNKKESTTATATFTAPFSRIGSANQCWLIAAKL